MSEQEPVTGRGSGMVAIAAAHWRCWFDDSEETHGTDIVGDALLPGNTGAEDAAETFVARREEGGAFAGDPIPSVIVVYARAPDGTLFKVEVEPEYSVDFYSRRSVAVCAPEIDEAADAAKEA
jgi:hypothetical protein